MNIFVTDHNPALAAANLDNKRVVKMCLETAQILCTALGGPYRPTHRNHPAVLWCGASPENASWLIEHGLALCDVYQRIYGRTHKSEAVIRAVASAQQHDQQPGQPLAFANCARNSSIGVDFTHIDDPVLAYRQYLAARWAADKLPPKWSLGRPSWLAKID